MNEGVGLVTQENLCLRAQCQRVQVRRGMGQMEMVEKDRATEGPSIGTRVGAFTCVLLLSLATM